MTFYVQTWDEYYTHVLTLGIVSGPVEGLLTLCAVFAFTAYMGGGSFWHRSMLETVGVPKLGVIPDAVYELPFTSWYMVYGAIVLLFATVSSILNVMNVRRSRGEDPVAPLRGLLPFVVMWILTPSYLYLQPTIRQNHLVPFVIYVGVVNAYSVGQMIVAHLLKKEFPMGNVLIWPLAVATLDGLGPNLGLWPSALGDDIYQIAFAFMALGMAIGVYGSFVVSQKLFC
jgi:ethanolaminephosphotransferase